MDNLTFVVKYRKRGSFFWKQKTVVGAYMETQSEFQYNPVLNVFQETKRVSTGKFCFDYPNGTKDVIPEWHLYEMKLGLDWVMAENKASERRRLAGAQKKEEVV